MSIWDTWAADPRYQQLLSNPTYLAATPAFKRSVHDILFNYGLQPTAQQQADYGAGAIEDNPYSVVNLLKRGLDVTQHNTMNQANAAGLEESGAAVGALNAGNEQYKQQYAGAVARAGGDLNNLFGNYVNTVGNIFDQLQQNPVAPATMQPQGDVGPLPGQATGAGTGYPTPQVPYTRTGPEAGWTTVAQKLAKPKLPSGTFLSTGHI